MDRHDDLRRVLNRRSVRREIVEKLPNGEVCVEYYDLSGNVIHRSIEPAVPQTLGERITAARLSKGISQAELASQIGVSVSAVQQWSINRRIPSRPTLILLAQVLDVSLEWLETEIGSGPRS